MSPSSLPPSELFDQLKRDEGFRQFPYLDSVGSLTIGYGRNLIFKGISKSEASLLLSNDIDQVWSQCLTSIHSFKSLDSVRQSVLANMAFNLGIRGLLKFKRMLAAIAVGNYELASAHMLDSLWHKQVGARAERLAQQLSTGEW